MRKRGDKPSIILRKSPVGAVPVSAYDEEQWQQFALGTEFDITPRTKRSNPQNRMYWSILARTIEACGWTMTTRHLHNDLKEKLGYMVPYRGMDGTLKYEVDSTAFDDMPDYEFNPYLEKAMALLSEAAGFDVMETLREAA